MNDLFNEGVAVVEWLSSWLAEQGSGVRTWAFRHLYNSIIIAEIEYLLHPSRDMTERLLVLKPQNNPTLPQRHRPMGRMAFGLLCRCRRGGGNIS